VDPVLVWVLRVALALLFAAAASHKLRAPREFEATVAAYALLPSAAVRPFARVLALAEVGVAAGLLLPGPGLVPVAAVSAGAALLCVYSVAIAVNLARGRTDIDCGCLGPAGEQPLSAWLLARNAVLVGACLLLAAPRGARELVWVDGLSILAGAAGIALCWIAAHQLAALPALRRAR
jgi:hypothetical protein